ncbi:MAG: hypothetical protein ABJP48_11395 [Erythrobacter sp.]
MRKFDRFLAIDWSGAKGERHKGIALALANSAGGPPKLAKASGLWSRADVLALLRDLPDNTLVGLDLGISLPFTDCAAFFPHWDRSPKSAKDLWAFIDDICSSDPHLEASNFVDHPEISRYFRRHGGREGDRFSCDNAQHGRGRLRVTELAQARMGLKPYSNFNLVGAAQVGKSSLTGMRLLHQLRATLPVWPIDPLPVSGSVVAEIYTSLAAVEAGRSASKTKIRNIAELNIALSNLDSPPITGDGAIDDHSSDALLTAAWLRKVASEPARWQPNALTPKIAQTEGWTFGAL